MTTDKEFQKIEFELMNRYCYDYDKLQKVMGQLREIDKLRTEKNAVILAHYYQIPPIQMIADFKGDSLKLAEYARDMKENKMIISSTVYFMAEMIKLLSPDKKVLIPDLEAGCSIASGMNVDTIKTIGEAFDDSSIVTYINTNADVKAESDVICTSANAGNIIRNVPGKTVIMTPDYFFSTNTIMGLSHEELEERKYLAYKGIVDGNIAVVDPYRNKEYLIKIQGEKPELDKGTCIVHEQFTTKEIEDTKKKELIDEVLAHPEVNPEVASIADMVGGTGKMIEHVKKDPSKRYLVITECDLLTPLYEKYPDTEFITPCKLCPYMKKNTLEAVINSLKNEVYEVNVDPSIIEKAKASMYKMFEIGERKNE